MFNQFAPYNQWGWPDCRPLPPCEGPPIPVCMPGVISFNGRTGAIILNGTDIAAAGGVTLDSPHFTGIPTAPTAPLGTDTDQLATTAFVLEEIAASITSSVAGVASFDGRTGVVTLTLADITGHGGAPLLSPVFTGVPAGPTAAPGTNTTQLATTAFVAAAIAGLGSGVAGVSSWNTRTGAVTLTLADVTGAGGAPLNSPAFTGSPSAATAAPGTSTTQLATTAFVAAAIAGLSGGTSGVTSFNGRTGIVTFQAADITNVGGALLTSPAFTGVPTAPTAPSTTNSTQLATTAFVKNAISTSGAGVSSVNGRTGAVTITLADISASGFGAFNQYESDINYAAFPTVTMLNVTVATIQPGDWDMTVSLGPQGGSLSAVDFFLSPVPTGVSNSMRGTLFLVDATGTAVGINDSVVDGQSARGNFTVPTPLTFSVRLDNSGISGSGASFARLVLTTRRVG